MAYEIPGFAWSLLAKEDNSAAAQQYRAVRLDTGKASTTHAGSNDILGVLQNKPKANEEATIVTNGITKARAGGTVTAGSAVMVQTDGEFVNATATNKGVGIALEAAANAGEIFALLLKDLGTQ